MSDHERGRLIPLNFSRPHPRYEGLTLAQLRGAISADLAFVEELWVLIAVSWALGGRIEPELTPTDEGGPERGGLRLQVLEYPRVVELSDEVNDPEDET